jgi:polyisoprenoid-binding protein YceI
MIPQLATAQAYYADNGTAIFYSKVPLHNFSGTSKNLVGRIDLENQTVDFYIDLETLDTGNGKRDRDMLKTLNTKEYPFGEFFGKLLTPFDTESTEKQEVSVSGVFKIHGHEKEIQVDGTLQKIDNKLQLHAEWILNLDDYNIKPPQFLVLKVDEEQEIEIDITLKPE